MGAKKSVRMDDKTYNALTVQVPDLATRYSNIIQSYFKEKKLLLPKNLQTPWRQFVLNEIPVGFAVGDWLSLVTNYKLRKNEAKRSKKVPSTTKPPVAMITSSLQKPTGQLTFF